MMYNCVMGQKGGKSPYDQLADKYDILFGDDNPYYHAVNSCERDLFCDWVDHPETTEKALDIGCGTGFHTKWLVEHGFHAEGIDRSTEMIQVAKTASTAWPKSSEFKVMQVEDLAQLPENTYTVIICFGSVLNHLDDWKSFARSVSRRLKPGGLFLFSYDNIDGIDVLARALLRQFTGYSNSYIREILYGRIKARLVGRSFNNHWHVHTDGQDIEVPLKYERTSTWKTFLKDADLQLQELRGIHLIDCFDRNLLKASAGVKSKTANYRLKKDWLRRCDRLLARHLYFFAANVAGIAVKK